MSSRQEALRKLDSAQVRLIRKLHRQGVSRRKLALRFGVSRTVIHHIIAFSTYKDIT